MLKSSSRRARKDVDHEPAEADEHLHRARAAEHHEHAVDARRRRAGCRPRRASRKRRERRPTVHGLLPRAGWRSATRTASTVSATSWVRISVRPAEHGRASAAASEPASRSAGRRRPGSQAPMNDLRETPTQTGRPRRASRDSPASTATSHSCHGSAASRKKPMPGIDARSGRRAMPASRARVEAPVEMLEHGRRPAPSPRGRRARRAITMRPDARARRPRARAPGRRRGRARR